MAGFSDFLETEIRDHISQGSAIFSPPTDLYVALHTSDPTDAANDTEVSAADYAREAVTTPGGWDTLGTNGFENSAVVDFGTTQNDWGTITHWSIWDASSAGNMLYSDSVGNSGSAPTGTDVTFAAGDIDVTHD